MKNVLKYTLETPICDDVVFVVLFQGISVFHPSQKNGV